MCDLRTESLRKGHVWRGGGREAGRFEVNPGVKGAEAKDEFWWVVQMGHGSLGQLGAQEAVGTG